MHIICRAVFVAHVLDKAQADCLWVCRRRIFCLVARAGGGAAGGAGAGLAGTVCCTHAARAVMHLELECTWYAGTSVPGMKLYRKMLRSTPMAVFSYVFQRHRFFFCCLVLCLSCRFVSLSIPPCCSPSVFSPSHVFFCIFLSMLHALCQFSTFIPHFNSAAAAAAAAAACRPTPFWSPTRPAQDSLGPRGRGSASPPAWKLGRAQRPPPFPLGLRSTSGRGWIFWGFCGRTALNGRRAVPAVRGQQRGGAVRNPNQLHFCFVALLYTCLLYTSPSPRD